MRILWVEDKGEIVKTGVFDKKIFNIFWMKSELENLAILKDKLSDEYKYELQEYSSPLFLAADLEDAWEIIKEEEPFDKIILDIEFPSEDFDFDNKYITDAFIGEENNLEELITFIDQDEYMGFTLAHLIISYYRDKFAWNLQKIEKNIVFFSANTFSIEDFDKKFKLAVRKEFIYSPDTKKIKQFNKNKESDFLDWLKEDEYSIILDRYVNSSVANEFIDLTHKKGLNSIRPIFEALLEVLARKINIEELKPNWWYFTRKKQKSNRNKYSNFNFIDRDKFIVKNFIRFLVDIKYRYDLSDIKDYIERIQDDENKEKKEGYLNNLKEQNELGDYYFNHNESLNISSVIAHDLYSIWDITSAFGAHDSNGYQPTLDTVNSLIYQLKEIILWFGQVMEEIDKK